MFSTKLLCYFCAFALKTVFTTGNSTGSEKVFNDFINFEDILIEDLDLAAKYGGSDVRRWAPFPQDLTSEAPAPQQSSPNFQPLAFPGLWSPDFWNSLPLATPGENTNQSKKLLFNIQCVSPI
jgi:hypothetical protein